ncbi:UMP-CMP kinase [Tulasnella sp. JGI-2019a]|nr:UMP-CMP kinase [Tulasnella sp. JGI-2019a]KAG8999716.1 UMP-CMP kinase [Tulasnella sp. JGI-2019a]KAG9035022.1 UMP-CMP kinase [Tulasnella sp. JGI-2019a]
MGPIQKIQEALHLGKGDKGASQQGTSKDTDTDAAATTTFDNKKVKVIFVLGGPGVGKGTQCANLVRDYGFVHLSAGDLLRAEQNREGSEFGELIKKNIREGTIVPMEVTIKLLENAIKDALDKPHPNEVGWEDGRGRFLVDGFPRKMDQAVKFDEDVCPSSYVIFFRLTEEIMLERLTERGKTSGREDDNEESIKKRFRTFEETSMPVIDYYRQQNKVVDIDASPSVADVYVEVKKAVDEQFAKGV